MNRIRLFIICDNPGMRRSLTAIFNARSKFDVVGMADCSQDAVSEAQKVQPDAILFESAGSGELREMLGTLKENCPCSKIFVLINNENGDINGEVTEAIAAGVDGCLSKNMLPVHLVETVDLTCRTGVLTLPGSLKHMVSGKQDGAHRHNGEKYPAASTTTNTAINTATNTATNMTTNAAINPVTNVATNAATNATNAATNTATNAAMNAATNSATAQPGNGEAVEGGEARAWKLPLTTREMEIYQLVTKNFSNKEIGKKLFISQPTVKSHVSNILHKLGLNNRTELLLYELQKKNGGSL